MTPIRLTDSLYYCGVADPGLRTFDIIMETKYGSSYNSYLLKGENKAILFETAKADFAKEYLDGIAELVDFADIEAVVLSHTEPDRARTRPRRGRSRSSAAWARCSLRARF